MSAHTDPNAESPVPDPPNAGDGHTEAGDGTVADLYADRPAELDALIAHLAETSPPLTPEERAIAEQAGAHLDAFLARRRAAAAEALDHDGGAT